MSAVTVVVIQDRLSLVDEFLALIAVLHIKFGRGRLDAPPPLISACAELLAYLQMVQDTDTVTVEDYNSKSFVANEI